eukprot:CAMPEP_0179053438 /NCGR_PEP_ID=MMETSP0796-20121207/22274_1 /TAXON_ID=73915 /ORGANISM="Pyrodinium bahamense, Strain pbaha01" /LENGTH=150 /DNA_ID=CAMNT_0020750037 /DNA_START=113 /DNA_END=561 /DNA_ORIENTATION=+
MTPTQAQCPDLPSDDLELREDQVRQEGHGGEGRSEPKVPHDEELRELPGHVVLHQRVLRPRRERHRGGRGRSRGCGDATKLRRKLGSWARLRGRGGHEDLAHAEQARRREKRHGGEARASALRCHAVNARAASGGARRERGCGDGAATKT